MTFNTNYSALIRRKIILFGLFIALDYNGFAHARQDVQFTLEPADESVAVGLPVTLHCEIGISDSSFKQARIQIQWRGDDPTTFFDFRDPRRSILSNGSLHISRVTMQDHGTYQCVASIDNVGQLASRTAKLIVVDQITFIDKQSQDLRVFLGQTAHFSCRPHGPLKFNIVWVKNEKPLVLDSPRMTIMPSGSLEIDQVTLEDQGSYRCNVSRGNLYKLSNKAILTVNTDTDAASHNVAPILITRPKSAVVKEGENVTLDCAANGNPRPWLVWLKDGVAINISNTRFEKLGTGSLQINSIQEQDVGNYQCRAGNQEDSLDASAFIEVQVPPRFLRKPQDTVSSEKKDLELACQVYGKPEPKVQWLRNGEIMRMNDYMQLSNGNNLKIMGLMEMDAGLFQCIASNAAGNVQTTARLTVLRLEDESENEDAPSLSRLIPETFEESADSQNFLHYSTRRKSEKETTRQYFKSTYLGGDRDESSTSASLVPGPPKDVRAAIVSKRFVTLSWSKPEEINGELVAYSVFYRLEGSQRERVVNTSEVSMDGGKSQVTVQGLQPDRLYHFRVVAHNTLGPGESSADLEVSTGAEANVPNAPSDLTVIPISPTSLSIEWKPPAATTDDVLKYRLFYMEEDSSEESHIYTSKTSYELNNLKKFTDYTIWVMAINSNGPGSSSDEINVKTLSDVPSEPPQNVTVETASSTSIIVRWEPPRKEGQNGIITGYKLRYKKQKGRVFALTAAGDRRLYAIVDLDKNSTYQVRVAAINVNGTGPHSEWHPIETYENDLDESQVPGTPKFVTARHSSNSITVSWGPPEDTKTMVRGYVVGWGIGIPDVYTKVVDAKQRHFSIQDLQPNCEYVIAVRACNEMGDGAPLYVTTWTKEEPAAETQAPLIPPIGLKAIVLSSSTVVLYWSDMLMTKASSTPEERYYTVKYTSPHYPSSPKTSYMNVTEMNCMITDLRPNTLYEFSVKYTKGRRESKWSMVVHNTTQEAPPSSPPRDLTIVAVDGHPDQITLNWQPPKQSNGLITGYMILLSTDENLRESDWVPKDISGDKMTTVIKGLQPSTTYFFKLQAKNSKGYGPVSNKISFTTKAGKASSETNLFDGKPLSMTLIIASCSGVAILCLSIIITVVCCKRAKSRRQNDSYLKGNMKIKTAVKPPDLWIHHDQMELKNLEKSHHSNSDIGPSSSGSQMNTLIRASSSHPSEFDHTASLDKRTYLPSYVGSECSNQEKTSTIKRSHRSKPISLPLESQAVTQPAASSMPSPACEMSRSVYPRTMYRSHLTMDGSGANDNTYAMQAGYDSIASMQHSATLPAAYPVSTVANGPSANQSCASTIPSCQVDGLSAGGNGTLTKRQMNHPLKSFSVPAPPPQSAPSTPQQKHVVRPQQGSSPYKKPMHGIICAGSPSNSKLRSGPGTVEESPSYSTEELNQEMANLEGLMKDLNAITASEFEC